LINIKRFSQDLIRRTFHLAGFDIIRFSRKKRISFLGLRDFPIKTIIDVGANAGQFARMISKAFPLANLYCFEPLPDAYKKLSEWANTQDKRVKVFNNALGESHGSTRMFYHSHYSLSSSLLKTTETCENLYPFTEKQNPISVELTTLDKVISGLSEPLTPEILIKLDVQGYEDRVIRGGPETFRKAKACILEVCLEQLYENQASFKDLFLLLNDLGYVYRGNLNQAYSDKGNVISIDAVFAKNSFDKYK